MFKYLILTRIHISLENLEETDGIGLMKLSVLLEEVKITQIE